MRLSEYQFQQTNIFNISLVYGEIEKDGKKEELLSFIEKINSGEDLSINTNNRVNRVFTPITNLKKEYRKYLRCKDGFSLMEIDFKSSHLFHLLKIIIDSKPSIELIEEIERVKNIAINGDIYQHVADAGKEYQLNRETAKQLFIESFLYGMYPNRKKSIWVKSLFPKISEYIKTMNRSSLSIRVQQSEAELLNNKIIKRVAAECQRATAFGVFDSMLIDENHFNAVYEIMMEESKQFFGYEVPLTTKDLNSMFDQPIKTIVQRIGMDRARQLKGMEILSLMEIAKQYSDSYEEQLQVIRDIRNVA